MRKTSDRRHALGLRVVLCVAFAMFLVPMSLARQAVADTSGETPVGQAANSVSLLSPIQKDLSASSGLVAAGLDPRTNPQANLGPAAPSGGQQSGSSAAGAPLVPFRNPAPSFSRNLIITRQFGLFPIQTEPSIAVDPTNPQHLVLGTIDYNFPALSTYVSFDGGQTWDGPHQIRYFSEDITSAGDPVVAFGRDGTVYIAQISLGLQDFVIGSLVSEQEVSSIAIARSTDGGVTWSDPISAARSTIVTHSQPDSSGKERGTIDAGFLDKPWIAVGPSKSDPKKDAIYVTYTEFVSEFSILYADEVPFLTSPATQATIKAVHSVDSGLTWSQPVAVSPTVLQVQGLAKPGAGGDEGEGRSASTGTSLAQQLGFTPDETARTEGEAWVSLHPDSLAAQTGPTTDHALAWKAPTESQQATPAIEPGQAGSVEAQQAQQQATFNQEANRTVQGSQPKVMPDGAVVIAYLDTTNDGVQDGLYTVMVTKSTDGGVTFSEPVQAGLLIEPHFSPRNSFFRYWGGAFPQLAVGPNDQIYILTMALSPDRPTDDGDIYLLRSLDGGKTWQPPYRINQDKTDRLQFFPSITVDPNGDVHAMWGDMRDDPNETRYNIYYTRSNDNGKTWGFVSPQQHVTFPDTRVTDFPSNALKGFPDGQFLGDYFSIAASKDDVFMVWADTRLGEFNGPNQQIGFAREQSLKPPTIFLSPASGAAGQVITIQGFGYTPDTNIAITVAGSTVANERTDDQGQFTTQLFMPITGEGAQNVQAFDETGNVSTASYYTSFGFDTIQRVLGQGGLTPPTAATPTAGTPVAATPTAATPAAAPPPLGTPEASAPRSTSPISLGEVSLFSGLGGLVIATVGGGEWWRRKKRRSVSRN